MEPTTDSGTSGPWHERIQSEHDRLKADGRALAAAAQALKPLAKAAAFNDLKKLGALLQKTRAKLEATGGAATAALPLIVQATDWLADAPETLRRETGKRLKEFCDAGGLELMVQRREAPVLLRIPPLALEINFQTGKTSIQFARLPVAEAGADADSILAAREKVLRAWDTDWDPARFHEYCRRAWRAARAAEGIDEERVEILRFLPYLAMQFQSDKFAVEPEAKNFRGYGRARFAYDVNRLREARLLEQGGFRLSLGVATGSTAQQKKRVIYFENGRGEGEYKLTVSFTRGEARP